MADSTPNRKPWYWYQRLMAIMALTVGLALPFACNQPLGGGKISPTVSIDLGDLVAKIGSRDLSGIESAQLTIKDAVGTVVFDQTYTQPPANNQVLVDLEVNKSYTMVLIFNCYLAGTTLTAPMSYTKTFDMPENGDVQVSITVPSGQAYGVLMTEAMPAVGDLFGWNATPSGSPDPNNPMYAAQIAVSNGSPSSGTTPSGTVGWSWTAAGSTVIITITALVDSPLGSSVYTLLAGSYFQFANDVVPGLKEELNFRGGPIENLTYTYDGTKNGQASAMVVNGFDYLAFYQAIMDVTPPLKIYVATTGNDSTGDGSPMAPYATIQRAITAANSASIIKEGSSIRLAAGGSFDITSTSNELYWPDALSMTGGWDLASQTQNVATKSTISSNIGSTGGSSSTLCKAIQIDGNSPMEISGINFQVTQTAAAAGYGSVALGIGNPNLKIHDNTFNVTVTSQSGGACSAGGIFQWSPGSAAEVIERNAFNITATGTSQTGATADATGIWFDSSGADNTIAAQIRNNVICAIGQASGTASGNCRGIAWSSSTGRLITFQPVIRNNTIYLKTTAVAGGTAAALMHMNNGGTSSATITMDNNAILTDGFGGGAALYGLFDPTDATIASFQGNYLLYGATTYTAWLKFGVTPVSIVSNTDFIANGLTLAGTGTSAGGGAYIDYFASYASLDFTPTALWRSFNNGINGSNAGWGFADDITRTGRTGQWTMGAYQ